MKKIEILDLNLIPDEGKLFKFSNDEIITITEFKGECLSAESNFVEIFLRPIDQQHYELKYKLQMKRPYICSRCAEDYNKEFSLEASDYLSLDGTSEGEDEGFVILESVHWNWAEYLRQSIELETPYLNYKYDKKCLISCHHYDEAKKKGWIQDPAQKKNAFSALEKLKGKLN